MTIFYSVSILSLTSYWLLTPSHYPVPYPSVLPSLSRRYRPSLSLGDEDRWVIGHTTVSRGRSTFRHWTKVHKVSDEDWRLGFLRKGDVTRPEKNRVLRICLVKSWLGEHSSRSGKDHQYRSFVVVYMSTPPDVLGRKGSTVLRTCVEGVGRRDVLLLRWPRIWAGRVSLHNITHPSTHATPLAKGTVTWKFLPFKENRILSVLSTEYFVRR